MKDYSEAMNWAQSILDLASKLPYGVGIHPISTDGGEIAMYSVTDVTAEAVTRIGQEYNVTHTSQQGYLYVDILLPKGSTKADVKKRKALQFRFLARPK